MIFRRHDEPGTPVYGRPYDEDADTREPEQGDAVSPGARSSAAGPTADPAHDVRADSGPDAPDWSGTRYESADGAAPDHGTAERDALPDGPALDRDTQPDKVGGSEHADRLVAGRRDTTGVSTETTDGTAHGTAHGTTDGSGRVEGTAERDGTFADADDVSRQEPPVPSPAVTGSPEAEGYSPTGRHTAEDPADAGLLGWDADEVRRRWHDVQVAFVDDPRESVERADAMVDEVVSALSARRRELMDNWKNTGQGDTERLRLALRDSRSLLERLTGPFHGADRGVK
jgi:hypothetical protein